MVIDMRVTAIFLLLLRTTTFVFATGQAPDKIIYEGKKFDLFSNPLEALYANDKSKRPKFMSIPNGSSSANWRGYVASWEIADNKLYLTAIDSWFCEPSILTENHCRAVTVDDIVGKEVDGKSFFATWFSGELRVPDGKELLYVHMGYGSVYERDMMFTVDSGNAVKLKVIDNTKRPLPSSDERALQELEKLRIWESGEAKPASTFPGFGARVSDPIVAGKGWNKVVRGATREVVESVLGNGEGEERNKMLKDVYFREYPESGIQVSYQNSTNTVEAIFFYNKQHRYESFQTPPLKTDIGIDWNSSPKDVLKAYGKPVGDYKGDNPGDTWRRIEYKGIDFRFENGKMVRIGILP